MGLSTERQHFHQTANITNPHHSTHTTEKIEKNTKQTPLCHHNE